MSTLVTGVDPGQTTGVCSFLVTNAGQIETVVAVQIHNPDGRGVLDYVQAVMAARSRTDKLLAVEKFVVSTRAARSSNAHAGTVTRRLVNELETLSLFHCTRTAMIRPAVEVKAWATDARLVKAGLAGAPGMPHAKDAARHALFAAVKAGVLPDPLSKDWGAGR